MGIKETFKGFISDIKKNNDRKRQEKEEFEQLQRQAKLEAMKDLKPALVEMYKEQEIEKMKKKSKGWGKMLADEFGEIGNTAFSKENMNRVIGENTKKTNDDMFSQGKIDRMLEKGPGSNKRQNSNDDNGEIFTNDKINRMLDTGSGKKKKGNDPWL